MKFEIIEQVKEIIEGLQSIDLDRRKFSLWRLSNIDDSVIFYIIKGLNNCLQHQPNWGDGGCITK